MVFWQDRIGNILGEAHKGLYMYLFNIWSVLQSAAHPRLFEQRHPVKCVLSVLGARVRYLFSDCIAEMYNLTSVIGKLTWQYRKEY